MAQLIKLKANYPEHRIQSIRMDNAAEFSSRVFNNYCMALGIQVQHSVPYVHTQNGLAESLIKRIKLIARPLLMNCKLPTSCWGHAVLHAADLIQLRPTAYHETSPLQLVRGNPPSISHLRKFGCAVYVPISPPQRTSMGSHRKLGIYVGYSSLSIIKYLEPLTGDLFPACFADCIFNEDHFPALGGNCTKKNARKLIGMPKAFHSLIHVLQKQNYKFKELLIYKILQTTCQTLLLIIKVSQSQYILQGTCLREWRYLIKPLNPKLETRGGEALPRRSKTRLEIQLKFWLIDT